MVPLVTVPSVCAVPRANSPKCYVVFRGTVPCLSFVPRVVPQVPRSARLRSALIAQQIIHRKYKKYRILLDPTTQWLSSCTIVLGLGC
jgi:hypothetical protein